MDYFGLSDLFSSLKKYAAVIDKSTADVKDQMDHKLFSSSYNANETLRKKEDEVLKLKSCIQEAVDEWPEDYSYPLENSIDSINTMWERVTEIENYLAQNGVVIPPLKEEREEPVKSKETLNSSSKKDVCNNKKLKTPDFTDCLAEIRNKAMELEYLRSSTKKSFRIVNENFSVDKNEYSSCSNIEDDSHIIKKLDFNSYTNTPEVFQHYGIMTTPGVLRGISIPNTIEKRNAYCNSWLEKHNFSQMCDIPKTPEMFKENVKQVVTPEEPVFPPLKRNLTQLNITKKYFGKN